MPKPKFDFERAVDFFDRALRSELFQKMGEPTDSDEIVRAKDLNAYVAAESAELWHKLKNRANNLRAAIIRERFGDDWFQNHNNDSVGTIRDYAKKSRLNKIIDSHWARM